jgi:hypothetical protein
LLRERADDGLRKSVALARFWHRPVTGGQLQAEMDRMARDSKDPAMLRELFAALGNEPRRIAECLARPALADRLVRRWYATDERFHGERRVLGRGRPRAIGGPARGGACDLAQAGLRRLVGRDAVHGHGRGRRTLVRLPPPGDQQLVVHGRHVEADDGL